jgi:glycosyltransferase involved in cell wall biosynthesis
VHLIQTLYCDGRDGIEQVARGYARGFPAAGASITTVARMPDALAADWRAGGAEVVRGRGLSSLWQGFNPAAVLGWGALMRQRGTAAVICHNGKTHHLFRRAAPAGTAMVSVCHLDNYRHRVIADVILCLNRAQAADVATLLGPRAAGRGIAVVANPLALADLPALAPGDVRIAGRGADAGPLRLGVLCRIVPAKRVDVLVRAVARLGDMGVAAELAVGGRGTDAERVVDLARTMGVADRVRLVGWVEDRRAFLRDLDVYVSAAADEPYGMALAEAAYYGVPIVAAAAAGPMEQIRDRTDGRLVPVDDAASLADAIAGLAADPAEARGLAMAARASVLRRCDPTRVAASIREAISAWRDGAPAERPRTRAAG